MLARAEAGVAGDLAPVGKAGPVTDLAAEDLPGEWSQVGRQRCRRGGLDLGGEGHGLRVDAQDHATKRAQLLPQIGRKVEAREGALPPPLRRQGDAAQAMPLPRRVKRTRSRTALALATDAPGGLLLRTARGRRPAPPGCPPDDDPSRAGRRHPPGVGLYPLPVRAPVTRSHESSYAPKRCQPTVEHVTKRPRFVTAVDRLGCGQLSVHKADESLLKLNPLRRLGGLPIHLPHHHNETGVNVQPEFIPRRERQVPYPCFD